MSQKGVSTEIVTQTRISTVDRQSWFDVHLLRYMMTRQIIFMEKDVDDYRSYVLAHSDIVEDAERISEYWKIRDMNSIYKNHHECQRAPVVFIGSDLNKDRI